MVDGILGKKLGMTQIFEENGDLSAATVLKAGPCVVVQRKTAAKDGYEAVQLGLVELPGPKRVTAPQAGHFKRAGANPTRFLREVPLGAGDAAVKMGDKILVDQFKANEFVDVTGVSKGRGFAGFHKRHHFGGGGGSRARLHRRFRFPVACAQRNVGCGSYGSREGHREEPADYSRSARR
jgi:large subunit ribosomal protein L3